MKPDYQKIFQDMFKYNFVEHNQALSERLEKGPLTSIEVMQLNNRLFYKNKKQSSIYKAYDKSSIKKILQYQKIHQLNNTELAKHFGISRNTIAKWKNIYSF